MAAAGGGEGIFTNDRLAALDPKATHSGHQTRGFDNFLSLDSGLKSLECISSCLECHHNLFQSRIARSLANPVDRTFNLAGTSPDGCKGIGYRQPKVVVTVDTDQGFA